MYADLTHETTLFYGDIVSVERAQAEAPDLEHERHIKARGEQFGIKEVVARELGADAVVLAQNSND